jgi:hypothetical protein
MNDPYQGVSFCPVRVDPFSHVQVADFSKVQFTQVVDSDDEAQPSGKCRVVRRCELRC